MIKKRFQNSILFIEILLIILVTSLAYLPNLSQATIYRDDWYYTLDGMIAGPSIFQQMFSIDRPARGFFFDAYFQLFGIHPAPYHIASFIWRLLMGLAALWFFHQLWPKRRNIAIWMTLLFALYPGYTRWMEGFENQPNIVFLCLMTISFALTLKAITTSRTTPKILLWLGSIVTGVGYLLLVDYAIGMEIFRLLAVFVLVNRAQNGVNFFRKRLRGIHAWLPAILVPVIFLFWRMVIFHNQRSETDVSGQLGRLIQSPLKTGASWGIHFFQSLINEAVLAWGAYYGQYLFEQGLRIIAIGLSVTVLATLCVLAGSYLIKRLEDHEPIGTEITSSTSWQTEAIWLGFVGTAFGILPVIMANRYLGFGAYSHYMLPASLAAAILLVGVIGLLSNDHARNIAISVVVMLAVLNQYAASHLILIEENSIKNFWNQVSWRMPGVRFGTTLIVNYANANYGEDVDAVNGPANLIYFPQPNSQVPVRYALNGIKQYPWTVKEFLAGGTSRGAYRTHYGIIDYSSVLVMTQSDLNSCVHVLDSRWPWFSYNDKDPMMIMGPYSDTTNILVDGSHQPLDTTIFGPEPAHHWCYYFEKAELALQQKDWQKVVELGNEADRLKLHPNESNRLELMPFLQAYAMLGDVDSFDHTVRRMVNPDYNKNQICSVLKSMGTHGFSFSDNINAVIQTYQCD